MTTAHLTGSTTIPASSDESSRLFMGRPPRAGSSLRSSRRTRRRIPARRDDAVLCGSSAPMQLRIRKEALSARQEVAGVVDDAGPRAGDELGRGRARHEWVRVGGDDRLGLFGEGADLLPPLGLGGVLQFG